MTVRRTLFIIILTLGLSIVSIAPVFANQNTIETNVNTGFQGEDMPSVFIRSHRVDVEITDQVARTKIEQVFVNNGDFLAEGTYVFPLPQGVTITDLTMIIDGQRIEARILERDEARQIYDEIVRRMRDPALLEYIGTNAIQASVFPIPPGEERTLEIEYSQLLTLDNNLFHYIYPLRTRHISPLPVGELSLRVSVESDDPISNIYSPTHNIAIDRTSDNSFVAGFETYNTREATDFSLYYGLEDSDTVSMNLLTYRESATEDGFFVALVSPAVARNEARILPKDVIIVIDQSGSMFGEKWEQAREAAKYVLDNLNAEDRFNVVLFSTGTRLFATELQPPSEAADAKVWLESVEAVGGTNIDAALGEALEMQSGSRQKVILFLTDGLATEGETETAAILENVEVAASQSTRIFTFGVGDDVDTFLLDALSQDYRGVSGYVRPGERINEEVSSLYNKISSPVLTDLVLEIDGVNTYEIFPRQMPDLFIGTQLVVVGRYQDVAQDATLRLSGNLENERITFTYDDLEFRANAGGEELIPRLWATRNIGEMLNSIRLNGENPELVESIVRLSIRYGIITPYTSFLITEDDILSQQGRERVFNVTEEEAAELDDEASGADAVDAAEASRDMSEANAAAPPSTGMSTSDPQGFGGVDQDSVDAPAEPGDFTEGTQSEPIRLAGDRTFIYRNNTWIDTTYEPDTMEPITVVFLSDEYFELLEMDSRVADYLALGEQVIFVLDGQAYQVVSE